MRRNIVALLVFGPNKLPQIGAGLGKSIRDSKKAMSEVSDDTPAAASSKQLPRPLVDGTVTGVTPEQKKT